MRVDELRRASRYPKFKAILQPAKIGTMINYLQHAIIVKPSALELDIADPHDLFLLELSAAGNADYLVTGDHRAGLLERRHFQRTRIVTPTSFCQDFL
jgi:predicted nucleic acid-binding protein